MIKGHFRTLDYYFFATQEYYFPHWLLYIRQGMAYCL